MPPRFPLAFSLRLCYPTLTAPSPPGGGGAFTPCRQAFKDAGRALFCFLPGSGARDTRTLPLGTAYAVWTGIGALGALIVGVIVFRESLTPARLLFAALLLIGIIGLKATA